MANNIISQYYTKNDGMQISNDYQFSILQGNEKIINKNSGEKFVKNPSYSNVFDKTNTFTDYLNDARSTSIASIDDATASGVCHCKNSSGTQIDTFTCHVPVNNSAPTLSWGQTSTIGTVDGTPLTVKMPGNPNTDTKYSAGTGLTLNGTTFSINEIWLKNFINNNSSPNLEIQRAIFSSVPVFGTSSDEQESIVGQKYAGSQLFKDVSESGEDEWAVLQFSNPLSGTWTCITRSDVYVTKKVGGGTFSSIEYKLHYIYGTFCKV